MEMEKIPLSKMKPAAYNPRIKLKKEDKAWKDIEASLDEFGLVIPIVWNRQTGNIVGGHQRYYVLKDKGVKETLASVVDLPLEKEKALNLALNKITGEWDDEKLADLFRELEGQELELSGFDQIEIDSLLATFTGLEADFNFDEISEEETRNMEGGEENLESDEPAAEEPTVIPSETEEKSGSYGGQVEFRLGEFSFIVQREVYEAWKREIVTTTDRNEINEELMIRLGI